MINPEISELKAQNYAQDARIAALEARLAQSEEAVRSAPRQTIWQLLAIVISNAVIIVGALTVQYNILDRRIDQVEKNLSQRIDAVEKNLNQRIDLSERSMDKGFEDFKQEVRGLMKK